MTVPVFMVRPVVYGMRLRPAVRGAGVDPWRPDDMHHLLRQPQESPRGAVRPSDRLRRVLGPIERVPRLPRASADVDPRT